MPKVPPDILRKIAAIMPRLGSNHDGEINAAARAIGRTLTAAQCDFTDLADVITPFLPAKRSSSPMPWKHVAMWCAQYGAGILSDREIEFIGSLLHSSSFKTLSPRQLEWLDAIESKLKTKGAA